MAFQGRLASQRGGVKARPGQAERAAHRTQASTASCGGAQGNTWLVGRLPEAGVPEEALAAPGPRRPHWWHPATARSPAGAAPPRFP